jgi:LCP family protein required for cell wall assembly
LVSFFFELNFLWGLIYLNESIYKCNSFFMEKRKVWDLEKRSVEKKSKKISIFSKITILLIAFALILFLIKPFAQGMKWFFQDTAKKTVKVLSKTVWTPMQKDEYWNVNMLLVGYGWGGHWWGWLADSTIVASWNPEKWVLSMLSIPRDLFVQNPLGWNWRINTVFSQLYWKTKDLKEAGSWYAKEIEKITGLSIPYFATIDFDWFKKIIDDIWGIDIGVPYALHDYEYPDDNLKGYDPLHVEAWRQHMDWNLALKYARSRHSAGHASDFDRSYRQQLVINAIKDKLLTGWNLTLSNANELYDSYIEMVNTNVSLNEMLWTIQYLWMVKMYTFWLNTSYTYDNLRWVQKGWFLYNPQRELFWWASVLLPVWASAANLTHYDAIHEYADFVSHVQWFLLDNATIEVDNWISKDALREKGLQGVKVAWRIATKMKRFWLDIVDTDNVDFQNQTTVIINTENEKPEWFEWTIQAIKNFIPVDEIIYNTWVVKSIIDDYWNEVVIYTWTDVQVILWSSYLTYLDEEPFKPDTLTVKYYD